MLRHGLLIEKNCAKTKGRVGQIRFVLFAETSPLYRSKQPKVRWVNVTHSVGCFEPDCRTDGTYSNGDFSTTAAAAAYDKGRRSVQDGLHELAQRELVVQVEPPRGPNPAVWIISQKASDPAPGSKFHLPTLREVEEYQLANKA
jgi:hypothetical protein